MLTVLIAEDDENDAFLLCRAFRELGLPNQVELVRDGEEAIEYLQGRGIYANRERYPLPCLLLTDLKMPRVNGFELLAWLRRQERFQDLPAIAVSGSAQECDIERALSLGASAYKVKPSDYRQLRELAKEISETWLMPAGVEQM